ncbi:MAG TPA: hypothetical protein DEA38_02875 [Stenotrophomonas sp.]|nr:hypothetical protein [Stenotrophomonas sp.]
MTPDVAPLFSYAAVFVSLSLLIALLHASVDVRNGTTWKRAVSHALWESVRSAGVFAVLCPAVGTLLFMVLLSLGEPSQPVVFSPIVMLLAVAVGYALAVLPAAVTGALVGGLHNIMGPAHVAFVSGCVGLLNYELAVWWKYRESFDGLWHVSAAAFVAGAVTGYCYTRWLQRKA